MGLSVYNTKITLFTSGMFRNNLKEYENEPIIHQDDKKELVCGRWN